MNLYNNLDGKNALQLKNFLQHMYDTTVDVNDPVTGLNTEGRIAYDSELKRLVMNNGTSNEYIATIFDVYDGNGNTTYISQTEPVGLPSVGVIDGDGWYNPLDGSLKLKTGTDMSGNIWTTINDSDVNYLLPKVQTSTTYPSNSVIFYSSANSIDVNVTNGTDTMWINDTLGDITTGATISTETDLSNLGFINVSGGDAGIIGNDVTIDYTWLDGSTQLNPTPSIQQITRNGNSYTITLEVSATPIQNVLLYDNLGELVYTTVKNETIALTPTNDIIITFRDSLTENRLLKMLK
jgi:hypothetical protein